MFRALCRFPPDLLRSAGDEGGELSLRRMANAPNVSFQSLHGGSIYLINSVDKYKVLCFASPPMQHHSFLTPLFVKRQLVVRFFSVFSRLRRTSSVSLRALLWTIR